MPQSKFPRPEFRHLPIRTIEVSPDHVRGSYREYNDDLVMSIRRIGLLTPIAVTPASTPGRYRVVDGARRLHALQYIGVNEVYCAVYPELSAEQIERIVAALNL